MNSLWRFLRDKRNQQVLGWLGGGLVAAATGLWGAFVYFFPSEPPATKAATVQANCNAVAIGGSVTGSTIATGTTTNSDCTPKPK